MSHCIIDDPFPFDPLVALLTVQRNAGQKLFWTGALHRSLTGRRSQSPACNGLMNGGAFAELWGPHSDVGGVKRFSRQLHLMKKKRTHKTLRPLDLKKSQSSSHVAKLKWSQRIKGLFSLINHIISYTALLSIVIVSLFKCAEIRPHFYTLTNLQINLIHRFLCCTWYMFLNAFTSIIEHVSLWVNCHTVSPTWVCQLWNRKWKRFMAKHHHFK